MRSLKIIVTFFGFTCLAVSGCMSFSPMPDPSRVFTLTPLPQSEEPRARDAKSTKGLLVGVGPIRFPAYLDQEQMVTRISQNRLDISENDRWAEPLEENFTRVLSQNLGMLLQGVKIIRYPWQTSQRPTCRIEMEVLQFEPIAGQRVELLARWAVIDSRNKVTLVLKESRVARQTNGKSTERSVAALSETVADLSREIVDTILARFGPDDR